MELLFLTQFVWWYDMDKAMRPLWSTFHTRENFNEKEICYNALPLYSTVEIKKGTYDQEQQAETLAVKRDVPNWYVKHDFILKYRGVKMVTVGDNIPKWNFLPETFVFWF